MIEKGKLSLALGSAQARHQTDWLLFSHLGLARTQAAVPSGFRVPYGIFLHGIEVWRPLDDARREALEGAALLVANSAFTRDWIRRLWAVEAGVLEPPVHPQPRGTKAPVILHVGRFFAPEAGHGKRQLELVEA